MYWDCVWLINWLANIDWKVDWLMDRLFDWLTDYKQNDDKSWTKINFRIGRNKLISGDFRSSKFPSFSEEHAPGPVYIESCLRRLLSLCYMRAGPIKRKYALCPNSKSWLFSWTMFYVQPKSRMPEKSCWNKSKLHKKYLFHSYQYPMVLTP